MSLHDNSGKCGYCFSIFNRYHGFDEGLRTWFEGLQEMSPEAHISCAGRGRMEQEAAFHKGASKAHYGHSSHNFNAAIDVFKFAATVDEMYDRLWFHEVIAPALNHSLKWYGATGAVFYELPHIEVNDWQDRAKKGELVLVE